MNRIPTGWPTTSVNSDDAPVVLAHEAPFALGPLRVEPGMRRIVRGDGEEAIVEPLVMQVLVALAKADGAILTRDELVDRCWGGRIVGDDSIARVIARLRKLGVEFGQGAFGVETITKVGYRLIADDPGSETEHATEAASGPVPRAKFFRRRIAVSAVLAGTMLAAGGGVAAFVANQGSAEITIGVEPVVSGGRDRAGQAFASDLTSDLARLAGAVDRINLVDRGLSGGERPDLLVRVSVERDGQALYARARLVEAGGSVLWSRTFTSDDGAVADLRDKAAVGVAGVIRCGLERSAVKYDDPASRRLFFAACDAVEAGDWTRAYSFARQVVARRPDVAVGWACLSMTMLAMDESQSLPAKHREARRRTAIAYARRAIELDPRSGRGYKALALARNAGPETLALLERGIRVDPESPSLHGVYGTTLFNAGYVRAGVPPVMRAMALDPMSRHVSDVAVRRLIAAGQLADGLALQATIERTWPDHPETKHQRIRLLPYRQDAAAALSELERLAPAANGDADLPPLLRAELRWRVDPASLDRASADREAEMQFRAHRPSAWLIAAAMNRMGERERAFAWLARAPRREAHSQWSVLFWPDAAPLRRDPRFFQAMAELGLVELWRKRGQWPDFCSEPGLRYDCAREAERLVGSKARKV